jgi:signal transduction histidine kinase
MWRENHKAALSYAVATASVGVALYLTLILEPFIHPSVFPLFFAAVTVSAGYGGFWPGMVAAALSDISIDFFFIESAGLSLDFNDFMRLGVFTLVTGLTSSLAARRKRAEETLRQIQHQLEVRVQERTAELSRANGDLEERNKELLRLQGEIGRVERLAAMGQIAGSIAHDLGTPLNSILGYTQMLSQEAPSETAQQRLHTIETQTERMIQIINQYLARSRSSFQKREITNVNNLIEETLDLLRPTFQRQEVEVATNLSKSLPLVRLDSASLQRVLTNLLDNAMDAMGAGGRIAITTTREPGSETTQPGVSIIITDTGPGIPPDILPKIFDFFVTTKAPGKGTGIGLAVCKEIVKQHGGTIQITSAEGQGTTVTLFLPAEDEMIERDVPARTN